MRKDNLPVLYVAMAASFLCLAASLYVVPRVPPPFRPGLLMILLIALPFVVTFWYALSSIGKGEKR